MKKFISCALSLAMICSSFAGFTLSAKAEGDIVFKHRNVVGSQTPYSGSDLEEKTITEIPDVIQGMRINQPVFRAEGLTANKSYTVRQELKDGTVIKEETVTADGSGVLEFKHARNCEMLEVVNGTTVVASLGTEKQYINGVAITRAPMSYQIYQRNENDEADIVIKGAVSDASAVTVSVIGGLVADQDNVTIENNEFTYTKTLGKGLYDITVSSDSGEVAKYEQVGVGDLWVAAGQSNMTDMGAITDGFVPDIGDPINENMHIIYAEDVTWHQMEHPAGEGRFFKTGVRTSPVTSFAREIAASENVPVGIVQSSVGGTNAFQWVRGIQDSDPNSGYLFGALKSCFDKMPSHDVKGILWYQGCNDVEKDRYAYNYKEYQQKIFDEMRDFFGGDTPIITTQLNDANQDTFFDAWSYIKDIQRQNEELYENVYVVGTGELELGDTIHNSAVSNLKVGAKWARAAKNVVYGDETVDFRQPAIDKVMITGGNEITLTFRNTEGLKIQTGTKRIGITNGLRNIALGDLKKEFKVRSGASKVLTQSGLGKGEELKITDAKIVDNTKVVLTTEENLSGRVAVDCMYGKRFTPTLVDAATDESVLAFYNVIAESPTKAYLTASKSKVTVQTDEAIADASLVIASYSEGKLLDAAVTKVTLGADSVEEYKYTPYEGADDVKVFLWKDFESMTPLAAYAEVEIAEEPPKEEGVYDFSLCDKDSDDNPIKLWTNSPSTCTDAEIGDTGIKLSIAAGGNVWTTAKLINNSEKGKNLLAPNGSPEFTGTYLFIGAGGNAAYTLKLPEAVEAGKYINFRYLRPNVSNNGSTNRTAQNTHTITVGGETVDAVKACAENDKIYVTSIYVPTATDTITFDFGQWGSLGIESIYITDSADVLELAAENDKNLVYIGSGDNTVQYSGSIYNSITYKKDTAVPTLKGTVNTSLKPAYSVKDSEGGNVAGVTVTADGLLTVDNTASPAKVDVIASYAGVEKKLPLTLEALGDADGVTITGDELAKKDSTVSLTAIPTVNGTAIPERKTNWSIVGDAHGTTINNGVLTVPASAVSGNITVKAELAAEGVQTTQGVADTFTVTIKNDEVSPYAVKGIFLKNCEKDITSAEGVDGVAIDTRSVQTGYKTVIKAAGTNGIVLAETEVSLDSAKEGVAEIKAPLEFKNAQQVKAYIINGNKEVVSEEIYKTDKTTYKNVPLVSDWITGTKSGLGMGAGIMAPTGAPYGVDPEVVDVADLNVKYTYDDSYGGAKADNVLWYKTGAYVAGNSSNGNSIYARDGVDWEQKALPIGNGYMGGMLFGLPDKDQIQLNEETFWAAGYRGVQTSVNNNNVNKNMSEGINGYMSVGNLFVDFNMPKGARVKNYYRDLNLDEAVAHVRYEYDGTKYSREYFASYPKEVLAFRYTAESGTLNFDVTPVSMHPGEVTVKDGEITIIGKLKDSEPYDKGGAAAWNQTSDLEYCTKIKVIADDGTVTDGYNTVNISGATGVTILVTAATDYDKDQFEIKADGTVNMEKTPYKSTQGVQAAIDKAAARMNGAAAMSYEALKKEHIADYKSQFDKVKFSLTDNNEVCATPTDELQSSYNSVIGTKSENGKTNVSYDKTAYSKLNKHLEELHYNYARYMMISSSRSTTMPATLQGKWCQSTAEIWGSCYCININMEMNYWFAGGANLLDSGKSLIRWFNSQIPAGRVTAKNMYKVTPKSYTYADGKITFTDSTDEKDDVFIMHTKQAIMGTTDLTGGTNIQSAGNTAWLSYNLWDLYRTSGDKELLANDLYPIMRQMANFYTQYLYTHERKTTTDTAKYPDGYYYTTWEGRSPEQGPTHEGIKYDLQLVAGMYDYTIAAAETLGTDADKVAAWKEIRNHLELPVELGGDGEIKEWAEEVSYNTDASGNALGDPVHRHISHLVGLYPGTLITRDTPELLNGAKIVLQNRGDDSTGWSCSNKFLLWARTLEGDKALELFRYQLAKKTYSNLFDTHAPFQIDGNFGSAAGVMELLMQSQTGDIYILPALPSVWDKGEISGIKAKNGAEVAIKWSNNKADEIKITPVSDGDVTIGYDKGNIKSVNGQSIEFTNGKFTIENAKKGVTYIFSTEDGEL